MQSRACANLMTAQTCSSWARSFASATNGNALQQTLSALMDEIHEGGLFKVRAFDFLWL